ncbi:MAG: shikimate dehydrogenase [Oscillospiraceae bacterium]|nr:shikimate dehydrogenase [Oscillospiraceae bacterium]
MLKKKYAVIGHPIGHTMSPFIHKRLFSLCNIDADYDVYDVPPEKLGEIFKNQLSKLNGFNITIPHKQAIIPFLNELDPKAKLYGSVNTFFNDNGIFKGYTTDPDGFLMALKSANISFSGRTVILGCGGVARTMAYESILAKNDLTLAVREADIPVAESLKNELESLDGSDVKICTIPELEGDIDILINATPVGMYPHIDSCPVSSKIINNSKAVFDAIYNPLETVLIQKAKANGAKAVGGMSMLVWQAVVAQTKWNDVSFNNDDIDRLCIDCLKELENR